MANGSKAGYIPFLGIAYACTIGHTSGSYPLGIFGILNCKRHTSNRPSEMQSSGLDFLEGLFVTFSRNEIDSLKMSLMKVNKIQPVL